MPGVQKPHCSACFFPECLLQRRERVAVAEAFDRGDRSFVRLHRQHQAGSRTAAVNQNRAGAAHAVLAAEMRAGEPEFVA
jgi:hypothetical protein